MEIRKKKIYKGSGVIFDVIFLVVYMALQHLFVSTHPLPRILSIPSHPLFKSRICMEMTGPHYLWQFSRLVSIIFFGGVIFIYLEPPPPIRPPQFSGF